MPNTVREAFEQLAATHNAEMAVGLNCTFQWDLSGENGGHWYARFDAGKLTVAEAEAERPDLRIVAAAQDWLDIVNHKMDYRGAYAAGKVKLLGDLTLHKKVPVLFVETHHKPAV